VLQPTLTPHFLDGDRKSQLFMVHAVEEGPKAVPTE